MLKKCKWMAVILLPLLTACSSTVGLVKKDVDTKIASERTVKTAKVDRAVPETHEDGVFHIVGLGETLRRICDVYGLDFSKVAEINKINSPFTVKKGDTIFLPSAAIVEDFSVEPVVRVAKKKKRRKRRWKRKKSGFTLAKAIRGKKNPRVPWLTFPVPGGLLTSPFGHRWGRFHKGLDIAAPVGRKVLACAGGRVVFAGSRKRFRRYGKTLLIDHGKGVYTYYAHLHRILRKKGDRVKRGEKIALVGNTGRSTGPHLHLEVRVDNNLYNPLAYLSRKELKGIRVAERFSNSPMGPVRARWRVPDLLTARR